MASKFATVMDPLVSVKEFENWRPMMLIKRWILLIRFWLPTAGETSGEFRSDIEPGGTTESQLART